jgi:hypothetical protein
MRDLGSATDRHWAVWKLEAYRRLHRFGEKETKESLLDLATRKPQHRHRGLHEQPSDSGVSRLSDGPRRWRSPELSSRGTTPRYASTSRAPRYRCTSSIVDTNAAPVTGPTLGNLRSRWTRASTLGPVLARLLANDHVTRSAAGYSLVPS